MLNGLRVVAYGKMEDIPQKVGDIIFFDWADKHDGHSDHVGIVERVEDGRVYTIEGNSSDSCKERDYDLNDFQIQGYGTPAYQ